MTKAQARKAFAALLQRNGAMTKRQLAKHRKSERSSMCRPPSNGKSL